MGERLPYDPSAKGNVAEKNLMALSVRQPWAHLIIHAGKNIENRNWWTKFRGRVLIHASMRMSYDEYDAAVIFCSGLDLEIADFPKFETLKSQRGGIVGEAELVDCVKQSDSPWFVGEYGFVLRNAKPLPFQPCKGKLGFFRPEL